MTDAARQVARLYRSDVRAAAQRLGGLIRRTPVFDTEIQGPAGPVPVTFKLEYLQHAGTFLLRGTLNALLLDGVDERPVVIASGGNSGIAAALASAMRGRPCIVVAPESAPHTKVAAMWAHGADVQWHGTTFAQASQHATEVAQERAALLLHTFDMPAMVAGAGVIGLELEQQVRRRQPVLVAVGGGGLAAGVAAAFGQRGRVVGVESVGASVLHTALAVGHPVAVPLRGFAADVLASARIGDIAYEVASRYQIASVLVSDEAITTAREYLWREFRIVVEPAGAVALAAVQTGAYVPLPGQRPVIVLCNSNTDPAVP